jgi:hypothetical protein
MKYELKASAILFLSVIKFPSMFIAEGTHFFFSFGRILSIVFQKVFDDGIRNNETYEELTKAKKLKELQKKLTKARKSSGKGEYN